jgi:hypothetical protein
MTTEWQDGNVITNTFMNQAQRRIEAVAHVEDPAYGAVGDGVTDDTAAIQLAFDSAKTVVFRAGATYRVTGTLYLSSTVKPQVVTLIQGNGATINFDIQDGSVLDYTILSVGIASCPTDDTVSGEFSGWKGTVRDLNFTSFADIVMTYLYGSAGLWDNCNWTATSGSGGSSVLGCVMLTSCINLEFHNCIMNMTAVETDTYGAGSFTTDAAGDYIPSSHCLFVYPRWPGQTKDGVKYTSASTNYFMDNLSLNMCWFAGGYVNLFHGGSGSHTTYKIDSCEIAYGKIGAIVPNGGVIVSSWFENHYVVSLRVAGVSPPYHMGTATPGAHILGCSISPHNKAGGSKCIDLNSVAYGATIQNCEFSDADTRVFSTCGTDAHIYLIGGYSNGVGADNFSGATLKITRIGWMEADTVEFPDNISITRAGRGLRIKEGSNSRMGTSTLVGGSVVVSNTSITANTRVFTSRMALGGTAGHLSVALNAGVGFTITSSSGTDTSVVAWMLVEPA